MVTITMGYPPVTGISDHQSISRSRLKQDLLGFLFTLLTLLMTYRLAIPTSPDPVIELPVATCNLQHEDCQLTLPRGITFTLTVPNRPMTSSQPFTVEVHNASQAIHLRALEIRGIEIDMGNPPSPFISGSPGVYRIQAGFPICTENSMTWKMSVLFNLDNQPMQWPLVFRTEKIYTP